MPRYAKDTRVTSDRSRSEIERTLRRYGCERFFYADEPGQVMIGFEMRGRRIKFALPLPSRSSEEFRQKARNQYSQSPVGAFSEAKYQRAIQQRWRALSLAVKAKLESVESGIENFDEAFMAQLMLADGRTMSEVVTPQIEAGTIKLLESMTGR